MPGHSYYILHKPYGMVSRFTDEDGHPGIGSLHFSFPKDVYPVGRLDHNSEGLLILTNDRRIHTYLLDPDHHHPRTYQVQVEGIPTKDDLLPMIHGMEININGKMHATIPVEAKIIPEPMLPSRIPPIRFRKTVPDSWLELILTEGKNHQIRKMTAKIGFPTLRLIRIAIGNLKLCNLNPGQVMEISQNTLYSKIDFSFNR